MAAINDKVFDSGLSVIDDDTENLYICSTDPGLTFATVTSNDLGVKATPTISAPADRGAGGREVTVSAITDGSVTDTGTATHWALTDDSLSLVLVSGALASSQAVTSGNTFTLTEIDVGIPDPA